jgi:hypothetical protein
MDNSIYANTFDNIGFMNFQFTEEQLSPIKLEINQIKEDFSKAELNKNLAGHINKEFFLHNSADHLEKLLAPAVIAYDNVFGVSKTINFLDHSVAFKLGTPWVNFQKKCEFNPPHTHGGILSFVLWINLPYTIDDEFNVFSNVKKSELSTASFNFLYTNALGMIARHQINADKNYENSGIIFSSKMMHYVNPFYTTDDYRISISGNFMLSNIINN